MQHSKKHTTLIVILLIIILILVLSYQRREKWHKLLTSADRKFTVCHVYETHASEDRYFKYIYKVKNEYYSNSAITYEVQHEGDSLDLQTFLVVYYELDPTIHYVIWEHKFKQNQPLGLNLDSQLNDPLFNEEIKDINHSSGSTINDHEEMSSYFSFYNRKSK